MGIFFLVFIVFEVCTKAASIEFQTLVPIRLRPHLHGNDIVAEQQAREHHVLSPWRAPAGDAVRVFSQESGARFLAVMQSFLLFNVFFFPT